MSKKINIIYKFLHFVAWIIFVGLCVEAGGIIVNFIFSLLKPELIHKLYQPIDLTEIYMDNKWAFFGIYSFIISISILKALLFYIVVRLMHKMNLTKPFNNFVSDQFLQISYYTLAIGLLSLIAKELFRTFILPYFSTDNLYYFLGDGQSFILMGAVIYIIATIFKKGLEIQNENDLTV